MKNKYSLIVILATLLLYFTANHVNSNPTHIASVFSDGKLVTYIQPGIKKKTMDAASYDMDKDGDIDIILAIEFGQNSILINDGEGRFNNSISFDKFHDSEDIGVADFDNNGHLDIVFVSEDDEKNELYFNMGKGSFVDVSHNLPVDGISNAVVVLDFNHDGYTDIIIGNNGANKVLLNNGKGVFSDVTDDRLHAINKDITQDLHLVDVNNDGHLDLLVANEGQNRIYINNGSGHFRDETAQRLPQINDESREVIAGDIDYDGDIDLYFANVQFSMKSKPIDRLLVNDGNGIFTDVTKSQLPQDQESNFTAKFIDMDHDGDMDILIGSSVILGQGDGALYAYINNGSGYFHLDTFDNTELSKKTGNVFDIEEADFNRDSINDLYIANRTSANGSGGQDILILSFK